MSNSNIDEILEDFAYNSSVQLDHKDCDDSCGHSGLYQSSLKEAKQAIQQIIEDRMIEFQSSLEEDYEQELLKARIDEISILRNGYGWGDALETSEYILDDRIADLQAKLEENSDE